MKRWVHTVINGIELGTIHGDQFRPPWESTTPYLVDDFGVVHYIKTPPRGQPDIIQDSLYARFFRELFYKTGKQNVGGTELLSLHQQAKMLELEYGKNDNNKCHSPQIST